MATNELHVIVGTGPVGQAIARSLTLRGQRVRMINRSGRAEISGVEVVAGDAGQSPGIANICRSAPQVSLRPHTPEADGRSKDMAVTTLDPATTRPAIPAVRRSRTLIGIAVVGMLLAAYIVGAAINDVLSTDPTSGGYEPPYTGYTGTPIQPERIALENDTLVIRGRVIDSEISCRTGMWVFDLVGFDIPYRTVSERAVVIHRPQLVCRAAGFDTASWDRGR